MKFLNILRSIKKNFSDYRPLVDIFIYKDHLIGNLNEFKKAYPKLLFAPVLKSNAYGHGLLEVAKILDREEKAFFAVDSLYEARLLRSEGIKSDLLIIGYVDPAHIAESKLRATAFTITSLEQLKQTAHLLHSLKKLHLKIDTGMHRQGILPEQIEAAIKIIKESKFIDLEGICSHFADSDNPDSRFTEDQIKAWQAAAGVFKKELPAIKYFHVANTAGTYYADRFHCNVARIGSGLYGINRSPFEKLPLRPALQMESILSAVKTVDQFGSVGYNRTYEAKEDLRAATVPVGYFEGVDRRFSNQGYFQVQGLNCPIIGRVSMNITTIDVTPVPDPKIGDRAIIFSADPQAPNSLDNAAKMIGTTPLEILVHIPQHLRRTVI